MQISPEAFWVILGMAVVTYATRVGGLWIVQRFTLSEKVKIWSEYIPGTVLVSIVAPNIVGGGLPEVVAAIATILVAWKTRVSLLAMATGVICVWGMRSLLS